MKCKFKWVPVLLALLLCVQFAVPVFASENCIYIHSEEDLRELALNCRLDTWSQNKTVILQTDLTLTASDFLPIPTFGGTFLGNGHIISGVQITDSVSPAGFFGVLQSTAEVRGLKLEGTVAPSGDGTAVGGLAGENCGAISSCSFSGTVSGSQYSGGMVGINASTGMVRSCTASGVVFGDKKTGGIAGCNLGTISQCDNHAYVNIVSADASVNLNDINLAFLYDLSKLTALDTAASAMDTGGIAGYSSGVVQGCTNDATVGYQHIGYNVGGIVGRSNGYVSQCKNSGEVYGRKDIGGIVGQMEPNIAVSLSDNTLSTLQTQLDELHAMVDAALNSADASVGGVTSRLNQVASYAEHAASAVDHISAIGSIDSSILGGTDASGEDGMAITLPQVEVSGPEVEMAAPSVEIESGGIVREVETSAVGVLDAVTQIQLETNLGDLTSAVSGMSGQMQLLSGSLAGASGTLTNNLRAINDQVDLISQTLGDAIEEAEAQSIVSDTSTLDVDAVTAGKVQESENLGKVYGDLNVGGIAGAMSIEYELDPEDDLSTDLSAAERKTYEIKAVIQACVNQGEPAAKRNYVGGITGRMELGMITDSENYAAVTSESGSYVGGIVGLNGGTVRSCYAKCRLKGTDYIGGIAGCGIDENTAGAASAVLGCWSMVEISGDGQFIGAISGGVAGDHQENYFVSETLAGINDRSYSGQAEPVTYEDLPDTVPDAFEDLTLKFVVGELVVKETAFHYGESFDNTVFPELPCETGYYAYWDCTELNDLRFDTTVTAVYEPYVTVLSSVDTRENGRPVFFLEGEYDDQAAVTAETKPLEPSQFDVLPNTAEEYVRAAFASPELAYELIEQWRIEIPEDEQQNHTVRYLSPDENPEHLSVYVKQHDQWEEVETGIIGSYLVFSVAGSSAEIAVIRTLPVWWVWILAAVLGMAVLLLVFRLLRKLLRRLPYRRKTVRETVPKKRHWLLPVIILLSMLVGAAISALVFLDFGKEERETETAVTEEHLQPDDLMRLLAAWNDLNSRNPLEANISLTVDCGPLVLRDELAYVECAVEDWKVGSVEKNGVAVYFSENAVCNADGKLLVKSDAPQIEAVELLALAREISSYADYQCVELGGVYTYTIALDEAGMEAMACAIAPAAEELDIGFTQGSLRITVQEGTIGSIAVACSGTMSIMRSAAEVSLATEITLVQETGAFQVPDQVVQVLKQEIE